MSLPLTVPPRAGPPRTFLDAPLVTDLDGFTADVAVLGLPYGDPRSIDEVGNDQSNAPTAIRQASDRFYRLPHERWDFDLGGTLFDGQDIRLVDCGDVPGDHRDLTSHYARAESAVRRIVDGGALIVGLGGDHGVTIPVLRALDRLGPVTVVQVDAHLDWRDEVLGAREGYSSPMRRASEMAHVKRIHQIGLRAQGSARAEEVEAARAYGARLVTAHELHEIGMDAVLDGIADGGRYYLTIDADGLDPSIMPAVAGPAPGGVTFHQVRKLIHGLIAKGRVVGMDIVEITPHTDVNQITCITAGRLICNLVGAAVRAGYFASSATRLYHGAP